VADAFASACAAVLKEFFGENGSQTEQNLSRIVAERHFDRLADMLKRTKGSIVAGGLDKCNRNSLMFAPTVVSGIKPGDALLSDEIFGPILPIMAVDSVEEAIDYINSHDKPLALYVFSKDSSVVNQVGHLNPNH
jgi:acyl-CoA reductase-like NAD-dependent aldehyde dehydrogenase